MTGRSDAERPEPGVGEPTGAEPVQAKPAYRLRLAFAIVGLTLGLTGLAVFGLRVADETDGAAVSGLVVSALFAVTAALDIAVIVRRRRRARHRSPDL
ncbi:hypothetical protein E1262_18805 [Jiangella aurantiaca]|uniref:Uncharacterized protein n=1 Tax=Jiangella aurantiaca TaxID=2530373 RepID=A0A4R5A8U8_9ACTN|nr:DUF6343 family protein [Jiangella aurantiaca]TDD67506.1 hypothetical protein E1262_18805 [Jiangella aurantiaca]